MYLDLPKKAQNTGTYAAHRLCLGIMGHYYGIPDTKTAHNQKRNYIGVSSYVFNSIPRVLAMS